MDSVRNLDWDDIRFCEGVAGLFALIQTALFGILE